MFKRIAKLALAGLVTAGFSAVAIPAAQGATLRNGVCDPGEFCYYYNSNQMGSVSDLPRDLANYGSRQPGCYEFKSPGAGQGVCIKNNAASVWNRTGGEVTVYYNSNHKGAQQKFANGSGGNLVPALKNQNASHSYREISPWPRDPKYPTPVAVDPKER